MYKLLNLWFKLREACEKNICDTWISQHTTDTVAFPPARSEQHLDVQPFRVAGKVNVGIFMKDKKYDISLSQTLIIFKVKHFS